jgi:hypothetical protein
MTITNSKIYIAIAEDAISESMKLLEEGISPLANPTVGGVQAVITFDPEQKSFKQSLIAIAFAGMYLESLLTLTCTARLGKDLYKKIERNTVYEEKLRMLGIVDAGTLTNCKRFREARNDLIHEKPIDLNTLNRQTFRTGQDEARFGVEFVKSIAVMLNDIK